ncbi:mRNA surveillance protein Pelota [Thermococcus sp. P6]|uniref:mRNA surveillance protein pelota n=1 Tax=Thermococcus sp. P6 TaxID=122420 RepID=UPI000B59B276|nr:mRNA surveillance protein pelota [Thermococcus sp. P6]ASJ10707.1 mRNA surveillance protein Pelota [Thermococcus sp. P6]
MQIIHQDVKEGRVKVRAETLDDLWHLYHIIDPGDRVYAKTLRKKAQRSDSLRAEKVEVVPVFLGVRAEKVNFHRFANQLRVTGPIVYASREDVPLGKYHTITVEEGTVVTIEKERWREHHLERLREAVQASRRARVMVVVIDYGEADMAVIRAYGVEMLKGIRHNLGGKMYGTDREGEEKRFFHEVARAIEEVMEREGIERVIVAGPGFVKEDFHAFLREKYPALAGKVVLEDTSVTGRTGIYEVIRRGTVEKVYHENRVAKEVRLVEKVLENVAKNNGLSAYGLREVEEAVNYGAVETLLVLDELLKGENRERIEEIMEAVRHSRGEVVVVSSEHEGGEKLRALGGLAALLRFKVR